MAQSKKNTRTVSVWVNAGEKAVTFARMDGNNWDHPLFVNVPNGVREKLLAVLAKGADGKATNNISWELPTAMIEKGFIQKGDNAGKPMASVKITEDFLGEWLTELVVTVRGAVKPSVQNTLAAWNPVATAVNNEDLPDF
jgi:hypothetical protein